MKELFLIPIILLIAVMPFVLVGCRNETNNPTHPQTNCGNFRLTITTSATTFRQGESIEVTAVFENLTGEVLDVFHAGFFLVNIIVIEHGYRQSVIPDVSQPVIIGTDPITSIIAIRPEAYLPKGQHELVAFSEVWGEREKVTIFSNTIFVTML